jgi:hypothetical protein
MCVRVSGSPAGHEDRAGVGRQAGIIHRSFRTTQHPEKVYVIDEVQDLFELCVDVIRRMPWSCRTVLLWRAFRRLTIRQERESLPSPP